MAITKDDVALDILEHINETFDSERSAEEREEFRKFFEECIEAQVKEVNE